MIALAGQAGRIIDLVVDAAVLGAGPAAAEAGTDGVRADVDEEGVVDLLIAAGEGLVQGAGLLDGAGEAVEEAAAGGVGAVEAVEQQGDGDVVGTSSPRFMYCWARAPSAVPLRTLSRNMSPVATRARPVAWAMPRGLCAFAGAGGSEQDEVHR